jgi:hypothetical protein
MEAEAAKDGSREPRQSACSCQEEVTMSDRQTCGPAPKTPNASRGVVAYVTLLILVCPFAALAAGTGAFLGMSVAVAGWGAAWLGVGAAWGAGIAVLLLGVWMILFVVCPKQPKIDPLIHTEKIAAFIQDMKDRGMDPHTAFPILFRLVWMMGLQVPPPLFLGMWGNFLWSAGFFGTLIASAGAVIWWQHPNIPLWVMWLTALILSSGVVAVCAFNASATRSAVRKLQLPSWDRYKPPVSPEVLDRSRA